MSTEASCTLWTYSTTYPCVADAYSWVRLAFCSFIGLETVSFYPLANRKTQHVCVICAGRCLIEPPEWLPENEQVLVHGSATAPARPRETTPKVHRYLPQYLGSVQPATIIISGHFCPSRCLMSQAMWEVEDGRGVADEGRASGSWGGTGAAGSYRLRSARADHGKQLNCPRRARCCTLAEGSEMWIIARDLVWERYFVVYHTSSMQALGVRPPPGMLLSVIPERAIKI